MAVWAVVGLPGVLLALMVVEATGSELQGRSSGLVEGTPFACQITQPDGKPPPGEHQAEGGYGNDVLWTNLWMWGEGEVLLSSNQVLPDGSLGPVKWAWYRHVSGNLSVEGRRLDAPAPPLRVEYPGDYGTSGFRPVSLIFPTSGCWEITGSVGSSRLSFVTQVVNRTEQEATPVAVQESS
jgi:hypothetical protein